MDFIWLRSLFKYIYIICYNNKQSGTVRLIFGQGTAYLAGPLLL